MIDEPTFTLAELRRCDGESGPMYIACAGFVYEVGSSYRWRGGLHENQHFPGQDLSGELADAPHGAEVFSHPAIRRVGCLIESR